MLFNLSREYLLFIWQFPSSGPETIQSYSSTQFCITPVHIALNKNAYTLGFATYSIIIGDQQLIIPNKISH